MSPGRLLAAALALTLGVFGVSAHPADANGTSWTAVGAADGVEAKQWWSVAYGNGVWVAVALAKVTNPVMRSTDGGKEWTAVAAADTLEDSQWISVAYGDVGGGVWVAVGRPPTPGGPNRMMRSTNGGVTWTAVAAVAGDATAIQWKSVAYGNGVFVAINEPEDGSANRVFRSTNSGVDWAVVALPGDAAVQLLSVAYGNGVWVVTAQNSFQYVMRSENDGAAWEVLTGPAGFVRPWVSVAYGSGAWVAVASNGITGQVMRSTDDGDTWALLGTDEGIEDNLVYRSVAYGNGVWVAVAGTAGWVIRSTNDGANWTQSDVVESSSWRSVAYGDGVWVAIASSGTNRAMRSLDPVAAPATTVTDSAASLAPPSVSCGPLPLFVGSEVVCTVTGGVPGVDILWRAAYNPPFAGEGVAIGADGTGTFSFVVPAAALGQELTVELVDWALPVSHGVVGGPVPSSVPAGGGPVAVGVLGLLLLAWVVLLRRRSPAWPGLRTVQ